MIHNKVDRMMNHCHCISAGSSGGSSSSSSAGFGEGYSFGTNLSGGINSANNFNLSNSSNAASNQNINANYNQAVNDSFSKSTQNVWAPQSRALQGMYESANNLSEELTPFYANEGRRASKMIGDTQTQGMNAWQNQLNAPQNPYEMMMKDSIQNDASRATENMLNTTDARAAMSGMSGGSRHGVMQAQGMKNINDAMQREMSSVGMQNYNEAQQRALQATGMSNEMANLGMAGFNPINAQWANLQNQSGIIGGPTTLGSSVAGTSGSSFGAGIGLGEGQSVGISSGVGGGTSYGSNLSYGTADSENYRDDWSEGAGDNSSMNMGIG